MLNQFDTLVSHGVSVCAGCGLELVIRNVLEVLGKNTVIVVPPGCSALFSGLGNQTHYRIAGFQGNLENTAAIAAGIRAGYEVQGREDITVLGFAGDGATVDIGLQSLSGAMERGDRILYICYDNEAYMNTGIQGSGSTPFGAMTTTTPGGKHAWRKDMLAIAAAHRIPYAASASVAYPKDLRNKVLKGKLANGLAYIHIHTPCPTGWFFDPARTVEVARLAVQTGAWELVEIENGVRRVTVKVAKRKPVQEYLNLQGRFKHLSIAEIAEIQSEIDGSHVEGEIHGDQQPE